MHQSPCYSISLVFLPWILLNLLLKMTHQKLCCVVIQQQDWDFHAFISIDYWKNNVHLPFKRLQARRRPEKSLTLPLTNILKISLRENAAVPCTSKVVQGKFHFVLFSNFLQFSAKRTWCAKTFFSNSNDKHVLNMEALAPWKQSRREKYSKKHQLNYLK